MSLNKVMLIGNVGRDPEVRYLDQNSQSGNKVANFSLATTERYRDRNGDLRENTEWHNIVAYRNSAELAEKYIHRGNQIYVEGRIRTREYTDANGVKKSRTEILADNIQLLGRKSDNEAQSAGGNSSYQRPSYQQSSSQPAYQPPTPTPPVQTQKPAPAEAPVVDDNPDDDLPF